MKQQMKEIRTMKRGSGVRMIASVVALTGMTVCAEDLAWMFDTSGRTADAVTDSASVQNSASVVVPTTVAAESETLGCFDSRWSYGFLVDGFSYIVKGGLVVIFQ